MTRSKITTLGCRLNAYESEVMERMLSSEGKDGVAVVNSCAVTTEAVRKSRQALRRLRKDNPEATVVATGCAAQIDPEAFAGMSEVDVVVGNSYKMRPETWRQVVNNSPESAEAATMIHEDIMSERSAAARSAAGTAGHRTRGYVQIQNGCDHRCTFCIIPFGRGNSRSLPARVVKGQVRELVESGVREVVLTGVDLTSWGEDLMPRQPLGGLVERILRDVPELPRLRLSSVDPVEIDSRLLKMIGECERLMPHLHLSLQAGDDLILKRMKRRHLRDDVIRLTSAVRRLRPNVTFGADIIAGFPTESDAHFENTMRLVRECDLTWLHVFPYSARLGTPAARMPQVARKVVRERAARLRVLGAHQVRSHLRRQVGKRHNILMETANRGRTEQFARVEFRTEQQQGVIVNAGIATATDSMLVAQI